jgi:hypothetical protein
MSWFKRDNGMQDKVAKIDEAARRVRTEGLWLKCED